MLPWLREAVSEGRGYVRAIVGMGRTDLDDVFAVLEDLYLPDQPSSQRLREFWRAADAVSALPNRRLIDRSPELVAYCMREALGEVGKAGQAGSRGAWRKLSRAVVAAKGRYAVAESLPGGDTSSAMADLLAAIDEVDRFHQAQEDANAKAIHNLVFQATGARLVGPDNAALQFSRLLRRLNDVAHGTGSWQEVTSLRAQSEVLLRRLFQPPDVHLAALDSLAAVPDPTDDDIAALLHEITNEHHVGYFLARIPSCAWLERLGTHDLLAPPRTGGLWPVVSATRRLSSTCPREVAAWLESAAAMWGTDGVAAGLIGAAALATGERSHELLLSLLRDYPEDEGLRRIVRQAIREADPTIDFVTQASDLLL